VCHSEAGFVARCRTTLLFLSTLKLAKNLAFASWIICSLCSSNWSCSSADNVSQVGSMMLLGETSELSLEPAIEGRFDRSRRAFPVESPKSMLTPFRSAKHLTRTVAVPSAQGPDGLRPGARRGGALCTRADGPRPGARLGLLPDGRTVRALWSDGPRVRRGGGRSPAASGSRSREGPRRGGDILGVV
jgi:hypothetical protein